MPTGRAVWVLFFASVLFVPGLVGQMAPVPSDPSELLTREAEVVSNRNQRAAALDLLAKARRNYSLQNSSGDPFIMKVSFTSNGLASQEGNGTMEETWASPSEWQWNAKFAGTSQIRLGSSGEIFGNTDPVPLRVQMVRGALFWPIPQSAAQVMIRSAKVKYEGEKITCLLFSGSVPADPAPRFWVETEYCINPDTGLLQMWSEAPGIYTTYDYRDAINFHGHTIPRTVTVNENRSTVLRIHVDSLADADEVDPALFKPTPEMLAEPSFTLAMPGRFPIPVDPDPGSPAWIQPVIVHAIIGDEFGEVIDAEALQTSDRKLAEAALDLVRNSVFPPTGMQREAFINVQFHRPQNDSISVYVERVRRVILVRRQKLPPRPPHRPRRPIPQSRFGEEAGDHF
jgi:hypothetical protein